jgi:hypothetical protein
MRTAATALSALIVTALAAMPGGLRAASNGAAAPESPVVYRLSADGDWLAAGHEGDEAGAILVAPRNPELRAAPGSLTIGGLFAVPGGDGPRVVASASRRQALPLVAPALPAGWCSGLLGLMAHAAECALQPAAGLTPQPALTRQAAGVGWSVGPIDLALGSGMQSGWSLGSQIGTVSPGGAAAAIPAPGLLFPLGLGEGHDASLSGLWRLAPWGGITLGATIGESQWQLAPGTAPLALDQAAVQVGLAYGAFSGGITGRTMRQPNAVEPLWSGLDIGFAWRTPWRGELSIGAQNLIGRGHAGALPAPAAPALDEATARTPYVRYTQDL